MAQAHAKQHDYHLVDPSPWPFIGSISALAILFYAVTVVKLGPAIMNRPI